MEDPIVTHAEVSTKVSSATTPALLLASATLSAGLLLIKLGPPMFQYYAFWLAVGGPILAALQIAYFTFADRDRLHTERHLERRAIIERMPPSIGDANQMRSIEGSTKVLPNPAMGGGDVS